MCISWLKTCHLQSQSWDWGDVTVFSLTCQNFLQSHRESNRTVLTVCVIIICFYILFQNSSKQTHGENCGKHWQVQHLSSACSRRVWGNEQDAAHQRPSAELLVYSFIVSMLHQRGFSIFLKGVPRCTGAVWSPELLWWALHPHVCNPCYHQQQRPWNWLQPGSRHGCQCCHGGNAEQMAN